MLAIANAYACGATHATTGICVSHAMSYIAIGLGCGKWCSLSAAACAYSIYAHGRCTRTRVLQGRLRVLEPHLIFTRLHHRSPGIAVRPAMAIKWTPTWQALEVRAYCESTFLGASPLLARLGNPSTSRERLLARDGQEVWSTTNRDRPARAQGSSAAALELASWYKPGAHSRPRACLSRGPEPYTRPQRSTATVHSPAWYSRVDLQTRVSTPGVTSPLARFAPARPRRRVEA